SRIDLPPMPRARCKWSSTTSAAFAASSAAWIPDATLVVSTRPSASSVTGPGALRTAGNTWACKNGMYSESSTDPDPTARPASRLDWTDDGSPDTNTTYLPGVTMKASQNCTGAIFTIASATSTPAAMESSSSTPIASTIDATPPSNDAEVPHERTA